MGTNQENSNEDYAQRLEDFATNILGIRLEEYIGMFVCFRCKGEFTYRFKGIKAKLESNQDGVVEDADFHVPAMLHKCAGDDTIFGVLQLTGFDRVKE